MIILRELCRARLMLSMDDKRDLVDPFRPHHLLKEAVKYSNSRVVTLHVILARFLYRVLGAI